MNLFIYTLLVICLQPGLLPKALKNAKGQQGKVTYIFRTKLKGIPVSRMASLHFTESASVFVHSQGNGPRVFDTNGKEVSAEAALSTDATNKGRLFDGFIADPIGCVYFKDFLNKKLIFREIVLSEAYLVEEPVFIAHQWEIFADTKRIGRFTCQKAKTNFRGRTYTAWFSMDIPVKNGPWKLHGLPGLILEAYDETGEVLFDFHSIELPSNGNTLIEPPIDGKRIDLQAFSTAEYDLQLKMVKLQRANSERTSNASGASFDVGYINPVEKFD